MKRRPELLFWFRLALALGKTVKQLQNEITSKEFSYWIAYYNIEPFGEVFHDTLSAQQCAVMVNSNPYRKSGSKAYSATDFMVTRSLSSQEGAENEDVGMKFITMCKQIQNLNDA
jgi:hypothetical protein